jgi:hypothetical protein
MSMFSGLTTILSDALLNDALSLWLTVMCAFRLRRQKTKQAPSRRRKASMAPIEMPAIAPLLSFDPFSSPFASGSEGLNKSVLLPSLVADARPFNMVLVMIREGCEVIGTVVDMGA